MVVRNVKSGITKEIMRIHLLGTLKVRIKYHSNPNNRVIQSGSSGPRATLLDRLRKTVEISPDKMKSQ